MELDCPPIEPIDSVHHRGRNKASLILRDEAMVIEVGQR